MSLNPRLYYLHNFRLLLAGLQARDGDLLAADELGFIERFAALPEPSAALLVRLLMRKGPVFRVSRFDYVEIAEMRSIDAALGPLVEQGWIALDVRLSAEQLFRLFTKAELIASMPELEGRPAAAKQVLLDRARELVPSSRPLRDWLPRSTEKICEVVVLSLFDRLRILFFGNFRQDLREFVLADLGVCRFESVTVNPGSRPFQTRMQVDAFQRLYDCRQALADGRDLRAVEAALPAPIEGCGWLEERRQKMRFQLAREYERADAVAEALALYGDCEYPGARARAERLRPSAKSERRSRRRRGHKTQPVPTFEVSLRRTESFVSVEHGVRDALTLDEGAASLVLYVENRLINSLFGLWCWRALFAPVPGAFFHAFHRAPADFGSVGFAARRATQFAECFAELESGAYRQTIRQHFSAKSGIASPFVAWGWLSESLLTTALECFPVTHLKVWFDWILRDVRANRSGFPDLVQFWPALRRYRLIEVKGPGDRLQENQRRWFDHCLAHDMPVSVCRAQFA